jgi:hypothetical protein
MSKYIKDTCYRSLYIEVLFAMLSEDKPILIFVLKIQLAQLCNSEISK